MTALVKSNNPGLSMASFDDMLKFAKTAVASGHIKDSNVPDVIMRVQAGAELGLGPYASVAGIIFIKGQQTFKANLVAGLIKQSGRYDYSVVKRERDVCVLKWSEDGSEVGLSEWTLADAKTAGLLKPGSNWEKYPREMCFARALTGGARTYCPNVFFGGCYTPEEIDEAIVVEVDGKKPEPATVKKPEPEPEDAHFEEAEAPDPMPNRSLMQKYFRSCVSAEDEKAALRVLSAKKDLTDLEAKVWACMRGGIELLWQGRLPKAEWAGNEAAVAYWELCIEVTDDERLVNFIDDVQDRIIEKEGMQ